MSDTFDIALSYNEIGKIYEEEGGNHAQVYLDHLGKPTAGVGHLLTAHEKRTFHVGEFVPQTMRAEWYIKDLHEAADDADAYFGRMSGKARPTEVLCIVFHMAFQLGRGALFEFEQTSKAIESCNWRWASMEMLDSKWYKKDTPKRAMRLSKRMLKLAEE